MYKNVKGMVLENPFASIPAMVKALYPQRWLPYHYLGGFALDRWDAASAMARAQTENRSLLHRLSKSMLMILSKKDEIVPNEQGLALFEAANHRHQPEVSESKRSRLVILPTALHENAWTERQWRSEIERYIGSLQEGQPRQERKRVDFVPPNVRRAIL